MLNLSASLSPLLGASVALAILANCSFLGIPVESVAWPAALAALAAGAFWARRSSGRDIVLAATVLAIPALHFYAPAIARNVDLLLVDAGDFNQYVALGSWLRSHAISEPARIGAEFNTLQFNLFDHQNSHLRLGAIFLLAFFAEIAGREVAQIYTLYCAVLVGLQATAVYAFGLVLLPRLPKWPVALAAVLYGISPVPTWAAYASFVPQTLGLAFIVATVAMFVAGLRDGLLLPASWRELGARAASIVPLGLFAFAAWATYPEGVPMGAAICGFYALGFLNRRFRRLETWASLARAATALIVLWLAFSPLTFSWGLRGLIVQFHSMAHGFPQLSTPTNLFATIMLASRQPLMPGIVPEVLSSRQILTWAVAAFGSIGAMVAIMRGDRALGGAIISTVLLAFAAVAFKYRFAAYGWYPAWHALYTWNLFKVAQFVAPFTAMLAMGGLFLLADLVSNRIRIALVLLVPVLWAGVAVGQDRQIGRRLYNAKVDPELVTFLRSIPRNGRLLLDLRPGNSWERYHRYVIYSFLADRPFVSTRDGQSPPLHSPGISPEKASFLSEPVAYILAEGEGRFPDLPVLARKGDFRLLLAKGEHVVFTLEPVAEPSLKLASTPKGLELLD